MLPTRLNQWISSLPLLGGLLLCVLSHAEEPAAPLFRTPVEFEQQAAALQVIGGGSQSQLGALMASIHLSVGDSPEVRVWQITPPGLSPNFQIASGASTALLAGTGSQTGGLTTLATLRWGDALDVWTLRDTTQIAPIPEGVLHLVKDNRGIPSSESGDLELDAYFSFLDAAHQTPRAVLEQYGASKELTYAHLFHEPARHRGEVVMLQGQLRRIRKFDAPATLRGKGIPHLYEGWIFYKALGANPFCILFTDLPKDIRVAEEMDIPVKFAGYFYKKYRYTPADQPPGKTNYKREVPLLIGNGPSLNGNPNYFDRNDDSNWAKTLLPIFVGGIFATVIGVFVMILWTRRSEGATKRRLAMIRPPELHLPEPDAPGVETPTDPAETASPAP